MCPLPDQNSKFSAVTYTWSIICWHHSVNYMKGCEATYVMVVDFKEFIEHTQISNIKQSAIFKVSFSFLVGSHDVIDPINITTNFSINTRWARESTSIAPGDNALQLPIAYNRTTRVTLVSETKELSECNNESVNESVMRFHRYHKKRAWKNLFQSEIIGLLNGSTERTGRMWVEV